MHLVIAIALLASCTDVEKTPLDGTIACGPVETCGSGQVCYSQQSGLICLVDPDRGIGQFQEFGWTCGALPEGCDGNTRDCFPSPYTYISDDGRHVEELCF